MANTATLTFTTDDTSGKLNDIFVNNNKNLLASNIANYVTALVSGNAAGSLSIKINTGNGVQATGALTVSTGVATDTAVVNGVTLTCVDKRQKTTVTAVADTGAFETVTVTAPSTAGATQGDYFVLTNTTGATAAFWLDINANGTAPTGAAYVAANSKIKVSIVTGGTSAQNGTILKLAAATILGYAAVDNGDGTVTYTQTLTGNCTNAARHNTGDTGNGSFTFSAAADGAASNLNSSYITFFSGANATKYYIWYNVNGQGVDPAVSAATGISVAIAAGAADTAVASATRAKFALTPLSTNFLGTGATNQFIFQTKAIGVTTATADGTAATGFALVNTITGGTVSSVQYQVGTTDTLTATNLTNAINAQTATLIPIITATSALGVVTITALKEGIQGNDITIVGTGGVSAGTARLTGGVDDTSTITYNFGR